MSFDWTDEQLEVIQKDVCAKQLVDAGPGTGKTAVTCARIAYLINDLGVEPVHIWLISFTRTAVHELRQRIGEFLNDKSMAVGIRIATIDAHAWSIQSGFKEDASLVGTYDDNIKNVIDLIKSHDGVFDYLSRVRHLFVDEAQDVIGPRCELVLEVINALSEKSGVTVVSDEAQSIYGFAEDVDNSSTTLGMLPLAIKEYFPQFETKHLREIHRTKDLV
ncbi:hypothetical protein BVX95_01000, partial [archaeon D22]